MHFTPSENSGIVTAMIIIFLILEFGTVLLSVHSRSLFGFFGTLAAFSGTIGAVLLINAGRDAAGQFTKYVVVKGVQTWRPTKPLFWANVDPSFIEAFILVAIICAIPASILFAINGRERDVLKKRVVELEKEITQLKPKSTKRVPAKTPAPAKADPSPTEAHSLA